MHSTIFLIQLLLLEFEREKQESKYVGEKKMIFFLIDYLHVKSIAETGRERYQLLNLQGTNTLVNEAEKEGECRCLTNLDINVLM